MKLNLLRGVYLIILSQQARRAGCTLKETDERKEKLQAIRDKLALFTEKVELNDCASSTDLNTSITQDDVELAFLYEKQCYVTASRNREKS